MARKIRVGVIFGGRSAEHEVSIVSAASVIKALNKKKYEVLPIGITSEGRWLSSAKALDLLKQRADIEHLPEHILVPDPRKQGLVELKDSSAQVTPQQIDVAFPVLHGTYGEDGTIQGLFELADIPYVGSGVLGSAVGMDKVVQKQLLRQMNIPVTPDEWFLMHEFAKNQKKIISLIEKNLHYPCFVKPANLGSSVGISKAHNRRELMEAIRLAGEYDMKVLVERSVENAREIECSVLGNDDPIASVPGEIVPSNEFYDYDAKYVDGKSTAVIPAPLPGSVVKKIQKYAVESFRAVNCSGMARVDFLVARKSNRIVLNELNTIPGFTSISMYPKLWQASGLTYEDLLDQLVQLALERHKTKMTLKTRYEPKSDWFKS
ncbi:MAG TPA: D-alanine--D-alanine ligase family protein [Bacteroidota bacterium]|nr:D-alanine--D-alanine ligase family protein [Bacteroidota bacterium]